MPWFNPRRAPATPLNTSSKPVPSTATSLCLEQLPTCSRMTELRLTYGSRHISTALLLPEPTWAAEAAAVVLCHSCPSGSTQQAFVGLIAHVHHAFEHAGVPVQKAPSIGIQGTCSIAEHVSRLT